MKKWKKLCALSLGFSMLMTSTVFAEELQIKDAGAYQIVEGGTAAGLVGGTGVIEGIAEESGSEDILSQFGSAGTEAGGYDTIVLGPDVTVSVPDRYNTFQGQDGNFYVCPIQEYAIPYVMFGVYSYDGQDFFDLLTMEVFQSCENASVFEKEQDVQIGDHMMKKIVYSYSMSGYNLTDTRLSIKVGNMFIVFGAKECPQENATVGSLLEEVAAGLTLPHNGTEVLTGNQSEDQSAYAFDIVFDQSAANYQGVWIPFDNSYQLYLPSYWVYYEVTDEEKAQSIYYHCGNAGGDNIVGNSDIHVVVNKGLLNGNPTMAELADTIENSGYENVFLGRVNGMEAIAYEVTEDNLVGFLFQSPNEPGYVITLEGYAIGSQNEAVKQMISAVLCSACPV